MKLIIILTAVILSLAAALILFTNYSKSQIKTVEEYAASIESRIFSGDFSGAVSDCADGLRHYPENAELYILKARAYRLSGETQKALGTLDRGYKETKSEAIMEYRIQLAGDQIDEVTFLPLTGSGDNSENSDPSTSEITPGTDPNNPEDPENPTNTTEIYVPDSPIRITIPNVTPPQNAEQ